MHQVVDDMILHTEDIDLEVIAETDAYFPLADEFFSIIAGEYAVKMMQKIFKSDFFPFRCRFSKR